MRCAVYGCNNSNQCKNVDKTIIYHTFPKDSTLKKKWVFLCRRKDKLNENTARICSNHFDQNDYQEDNLLAQYSIVKKLKILKKGTVPTKLLPSVTTNIYASENSASRSNRLLKRIKLSKLPS